ncbi:MAG: metallophosphoesterase [Desulfobulbaceae bacterium]|nr:MAG: metallophosphoesterase [Desulfobulbaceae bacterium]
MATRIGILSDTHLSEPSEQYLRSVNMVFSNCSIIFHAGDITSLSVLEVFKKKQLYAVHGNMCHPATTQALPASRVVNIDNYRFAICHGAGMYHNIEERLFEQFSDVDCVVFGHTHNPVIRQFGSMMMINPGSFQPTGQYGHPGTYATIEITETGLQAKIQKLPQNR